MHRWPYRCQRLSPVGLCGTNTELRLGSHSWPGASMTLLVVNINVTVLFLQIQILIVFAENGEGAV